MWRGRHQLTQSLFPLVFFYLAFLSNSAPELPPHHKGQKHGYRFLAWKILSWISIVLLWPGWCWNLTFSDRESYQMKHRIFRLIWTSEKHILFAWNSNVTGYCVSIFVFLFSKSVGAPLCIVLRGALLRHCSGLATRILLPSNPLMRVASVSQLVSCFSQSPSKSVLLWPAHPPHQKALWGRIYAGSLHLGPHLAQQSHDREAHLGE